MKPSERFREARNILFERGLNKNGHYVGDDGSVCTFGACSAAGMTMLDAGMFLYPAFNQLHPERGMLTAWNDRVATLDDVVELLERAEKIAEEREADA